MGTVSITAGPLQASEQPAVSRGGRRRTTVYGTFSMSASYATGGDTITVPNASSYGTLVFLTVSPSISGGYALSWATDGSAKIQAYDVQDATAANLGDEAGSTADLSTITGLRFMAVYEK